MTSDGQPAAVDEAGTAEKPSRATTKRATTRALVLPETMTVQYLAEVLDQNPIDVIKQLMRNGIMASMNQVVEYKVATLVTTALSIRTSMAEPQSAAKVPAPEGFETVDESELVTRPPVVTILGHVDHGKTSLLDSIKNSKVADKEVGGITQHIGAYQVESNGSPITFLDTPGHAAFTAIRARGARVTDIAVLVVAADDGIMPQTLEAINHAKAAEVPIIVAINKMDLPGADPEKIKRQLSEQELLVEDWGGDVISVDVSAKTGAGIDNLLENLLLVAEIGELRANPNKSAYGVVVEAKLDRKRGPSTTVLIQDGTLSVGDFIVAGVAVDRVLAATTVDGVVSLVAGNVIVADVGRADGVTVDLIVAMAAVDRVVAVATLDVIVAVTAVDVVVAVAVQHHVVAVTTLHDVVTAAAVDRVVTMVAVDRVCTVTGGDLVVTMTTVDDVVGVGTAENRVVAITPVDVDRQVGIVVHRRRNAREINQVARVAARDDDPLDRRR